MFRFFTLILCLVLSVPAWCDRVLIVADEWPQMDVLEKYLEDEGNVMVERAVQDEMPKRLSYYDAIIEFIHGDFKDKPAAAMMDYAKEGGRVIVLHHGISSAKKNTKGWYEFLGVELDRSENAKKRYRWIHDVTLTLVNVNPGHFITTNEITYPLRFLYTSSDEPSTSAELPALEFPDSEVFLNHQFTDARAKTVLFGFYYHDQESGKTYMQDRGGWYKPVGDGWAFYFMPGHTELDFHNNNYCQLILNCLLWRP